MEVQAMQSMPSWRPAADSKAAWPVAGDRFAAEAWNSGVGRGENAAGAAIGQAWPTEEQKAEAEPIEPPPQRFRAEFRYDKGRNFVELLNDITERVLWTVPARAVVEAMSKGGGDPAPGARLNEFA